METIAIKENIEKRAWEVVENFAYKSRDKKHIFYIPKGFLTDIASVPRFFRIFYPKCKIGYTTASIVHDFVLKETRDRKLADNIFKEILHATADELTEGIFYNAVRLFSRFKKWRVI